MSLNNNILVKLENTGVMLDNKWLVKGVSLEVKKGKIVTLIGPNGSGKSTTAKIALGIYKSVEGKVEKFTDKIGYVPQKISIDWTLPIRVSDFMMLTEVLTNDEINNALKLTGVDHLKNYDLRFLGEDYKDGSYTGKDLPIKIVWIDRKHNFSTTKLKKMIYQSLSSSKHI